MFRMIIMFLALFIIVQPETLLAAKLTQKKNLENTEKSSCPILCPKGWDKIQDRSQLPAKIAVMFVGSKKGSFAPSINLATEKSNLSIEEYLKEAEKYHSAVAGTVVTSLGRLTTKAGELNLIQIDRPTSWGEVRFIQGALIRENEAYVITATCLNEDFPQLSKTIFSTMQSLTLPELKEKNIPDK